MIPVPITAFNQPESQDMFDANPDYWSSYGNTARSIVAGSLKLADPAPPEVKDHPTYNALVMQMTVPAANNGWVNNSAVGYNDAVWSGSNYLYLNDPNSPHNKVKS